MIEVTLHEPIQAHKLFSDVWLQAKNLILSGRKQVLTLVDYEDSLTSKQRRFYHGFILTEIAKQASVDGRRYSMATWKEHFRNIYLGDKVVTEVNPMTGVETKRLIRVSSESLGVKGYTLLIEQVTAFAVTDLNVVFDKSFDEWLAENDH